MDPYLVSEILYKVLLSKRLLRKDFKAIVITLTNVKWA